MTKKKKRSFISDWLQKMDEIETLSKVHETLSSLESQAQGCASNVSFLLSSLQQQLHDRGAITVQHLSAFSSGASQVAECVDACVASMSSFIDKSDELNAEMRAIEPLSLQIGAMKQTLELLAALLRQLIKAKKDRERKEFIEQQQLEQQLAAANAMVDPSE
jgi:BLOC-1-related complex sub-unit 6 C-terminal helix